METQNENTSTNGSSSPFQINSGDFKPDFPKMIDRLKKIVTNPEGVWPEIKEEQLDIKSLYLNYLVILAAIGPVSTFIGSSILGDSPFFSGLSTMLITYLVTLVMVFVFSLIVEKLATYFEGSCSQIDAMKWIVFSSFPSFFIGIVGLIPSALIQILQLLGLYSIYVLWVGTTPMTAVPESKKAAFFITLIGIGIVLAVVVGSITAI